MCPHSGTRDRLGWRRCSRALIGSSGGLEEASLPKKKDYFPLFFYRCQGIVNTLKKVDTPKNTGAAFLLTCMHSVTSLFYIVSGVQVDVNNQHEETKSRREHWH